MEDHAEQRGVDLERTVVFDQAQFAELVHEEVHARPGRPDHLRQRLLGNPRDVGTAPYNYGVVSGALPTGVAMTQVGGIGLISGPPRTAGSYSFTVRGTDSLGCFVERSYFVVITTSVPTMPEMYLMLLAVLLATVGYVHLRKA